MGTVSKALSLLDFFNRAQPLIGLSELARLSAMNKATVHRLMTELAEQGFVEQAGSGREYRLGPAFLRLASLREAAVPMRDLCQQVLRSLSDATQETAHFSQLQGDCLATLAYAYSPHHGTRVTMEDADVLTFHATSSGLAVLAYSPPAFVDTMLSRPLPPRTSDTVTDPARLRGMLAEIRSRGIAEYVGGFEEDVHSHAAPIFDASQTVIGALAVAAPVSRMGPEQRLTIRRAVKQHALDLTRLLGGFPPDDFNRDLPH
jgi:DNA-binding IclR family transcriptional regulator